MKTRTIRAALLTGVAALLLLSAAATRADGAMKVDHAIWADGALFGTVLTPTSFQSPPLHSLDRLYNFDMSGLMGQRSVAESAPGDPTYNGGRWWVQKAVFTTAGKAALDPDGDGVVNAELTSAPEVLQQVALGNLEILSTSVFFECPLIPSP